MSEAGPATGEGARMSSGPATQVREASRPPVSSVPRGSAEPVRGGARTTVNQAGPAGRPVPPPQPGGGMGLGGPRKARLTVARLDPWGVFKLSFLLSVGLGIAYVVAIAVLWGIVDAMGVFRQLQEVFQQFEGDGSEFSIYRYVGLPRVLSLAVVVAVANTVILTLLSTLFAVLYNLGGALVGGVRVTLTDE